MSEGSISPVLRHSYTAERLAEALWDYRERIDPSGELTGCTAGDTNRAPVFWQEAVAEDRWPGSRREVLAEAEAVLEMLNAP